MSRETDKGPVQEENLTRNYDGQLQAWIDVAAECNFEEYPSFSMNVRDSDLSPRTYEKWVNATDGVAMRKEWTVIPSSEHGPLGPTDQDVFVAVQQLISQRGGMPEDGELEFSFSELLNILRWKPHGNNYRTLRTSLARIKQTTFRSSDAFYHEESKSYISDEFSIWDVKFRKTESRRGKSTSHKIIFGKLFLQSWLARYIKGLDAAIYHELSSAVAKRLYRLIDIKRNGFLHWDCDLKELSRQIPLSHGKYPSYIAQKLTRPHEELVRQGFLKNVEIAEGRVHYEISKEYAVRSRTREAVSDPKELIAVERLLSENVREGKAVELVKGYGADSCMRYADALQYQEQVRNRPGWLVKAIERQYQLEPLEERQPALDSTQGRSEQHESVFRSLSGGTTSQQESVDQVPQGSVVQSQQRLHTPDPDPKALEVWEKALEDIADEINAPSLRVWFEGTIPVSFVEETLTISVPNEFAKEYIESRFLEMLESALASQLSPTASLQIAVGLEQNAYNTDIG
jgi:hypothetical protein